MTLDEVRCRGLLDIAAGEAAKHAVRQVELIVSESSEALTRFANNTIHQNVAELEHTVSVRTQIDRRTARASTNRLDPESIRTAVQQAVAMMRVQEPDEHLLDMASPAVVEPVARWSARTESCSPRERAERVRGAIGIAEAAGQTAAGILSTEWATQAILNTNGVFGLHRQTMSVFSITTMAEDSSGWAKESATDVAELDVARLARRATDKAMASARPREVEPGAYTVVLEPAAVLDFVGQMFPDFSATAIEDQRSFLTPRMGQQVFGKNIHIYDDSRHPLQSGEPFDGEGVPRKRLTLVDSGVAREVAYSRAAAHRKGVEPTGHGFPLPNEAGEMPVNIVIAGGEATLDQMIASTKRGLLITRLWYIREVDPFEKLATGMTRDGTFLIEDGRIASGVRNMRFNESIVDLLSCVEMLGPAERTSGEETFDMVVPAMKASQFRFTEVTRF
jgi:predicted Zn-dependent protease